MFGGDGKDLLNGGAGFDYLEGGQGDDIYIVDITGDMVVEQAGAGTDLVRSSTISLNLADYANVENLRLTGGGDLGLTGNSGSNILIGNGGANVIRGKGGADTIKGGAGYDRLFGDGGADKIDGGSGDDTLF